jgi:hypothetical protein
MTYFQYRDALVLAQVETPHGGGWPLAKRTSSIGRRIGDYIRTLADYYAAAATYEQLSRLSDAELQRRGLSRERLARDVLEACDRPQA